MICPLPETLGFVAVRELCDSIGVKMNYLNMSFDEKQLVQFGCLDKAKYIYFFNDSRNLAHYEDYEVFMTMKKLENVAHQAYKVFQINIPLAPDILMTSFNDFNKCTIVSYSYLKGRIFSQAIFNPGLLTVIQNLLRKIEDYP
jgi:hypothetical protein